MATKLPFESLAVLDERILLTYVDVLKERAREQEKRG